MSQIPLTRDWFPSQNSTAVSFMNGGTVTSRPFTPNESVTLLNSFLQIRAAAAASQHTFPESSRGVDGACAPASALSFLIWTLSVHDDVTPC